LIAIANHEQLNMLQPVSYDDHILKKTLDLNHLESRYATDAITPYLQLVFSATNKSNDRLMKAVSTAILVAFFAPPNYAETVISKAPSSPETIYKFNGCNIRVQNLLGGHLRISTRSSPPAAGYTGPLKRDEEKSNTSIMMSCDKPDTVSLRNCGLELEDGKLHISDYDNLTPDELKLLNLERVELKGKNWQGTGVTETPVLSPDGRRSITF